MRSCGCPDGEQSSHKSRQLRRHGAVDADLRGIFFHPVEGKLVGWKFKACNPAATSVKVCHAFYGSIITPQDLDDWWDNTSLAAKDVNGGGKLAVATHPTVLVLLVAIYERISIHSISKPRQQSITVSTGLSNVPGLRGVDAANSVGLFGWPDARSRMAMRSLSLIFGRPTPIGAP